MTDRSRRPERPARSAADVAEVRDDACRLGARPNGDDGYFEQMTKVIFRVGFSREVIERKWPGFRRAFAGFAVDKVASFGPADLERLLHDADIVRNRRKLNAVVENARVFATIRAEHGSFARYLRDQARLGEDAMCAALRERFSFLGGDSALFFLRSVGEKMPETLSRRLERAQRVESRAARRRPS